MTLHRKDLALLDGGFYFLRVLSWAIAVVAILSAGNWTRATGATSDWNIVTGDWSIAGNWKGGVPGSSDYAVIQNGGTARITQTGETARVLYVGYYNGSGTVVMSSGDLTAMYEEIGNGGNGMFKQTGGTHTISSSILIIGDSAGFSGTYNLSGSGILNAMTVEIGESGTGTFAQTGGMSAISDSLYVGYSYGTGTYTLEGTGVLSAANEYVGGKYYSTSATGYFTQTGGTNTVSDILYIGYNATCNGTYALSGSGVLSAATEYIGYSDGVGTFNQSGGTHNVGVLTIGATGSYAFSGGTLNVISNLTNNGVMDLSGGAGTINVNSAFLDFSSGTLSNAQNATLNADAHSLVIVANGQADSFPGTFGHYNNAGLIYEQGSALSIDAARSISGSGTIAGHVTCDGTLSATDGQGINLAAGLNARATSILNLGTGRLTVNDSVSGIDRGSVTAGDEAIGYTGSGSFTQNSGTNSVIRYLLIGVKPGVTGVYNLGGTAVLSVAEEHLGGEYANETGTGIFYQTGGTNTVSSALALGYIPGSSGEYYLSGSGSLSAQSESIGFCGSGKFVQTGGTNTASGFSLGDYAGAAGTFELAGGTISAGTETIGGIGTGTFTQTAGTNTVTSSGLVMASNANSIGSYNLSGTGTLVTTNIYVGLGGNGTFDQSSGTNTISDRLYVGYNAGSTGTYNLSDTGVLSAAVENIGFQSGSTGTFSQSGGTNTAAVVAISSQSAYTLGGGTLNINSGLTNAGTMDLAGGTATIYANSAFLDFSAGTLKNTQNASINADSHSLIIVAGGKAATFPQSFASYSNAGLLYEQGAMLSIDAARSISGSGTIAGHVNCDGNLTASAGRGINVGGGVNVGANGTINLGTGALTVNDTISKMDGGSVSASTETIGAANAGSFTQTGGSNTVSLVLFLGANSGKSGAYSLSGTGALSSASEQVGYNGSGTFTQTGGTNAIGTSLYLGYNLGASGTYNLNGGTLTARTILKGSGSAYFNFGGGTIRANGIMSASLPMTLTGNGGNATIDSAGYNANFSGVLSGPGGLTKVSAGTLTLLAANTFIGPVNFNGGTIKASALSNLGNGTVLNFDGGGLQFSGIFDPSARTMIFLSGGATLDTQSSTIAISHAIGGGGAGGLTKLGSGILSLYASPNYLGPTTIGGGTVQLLGGTLPPTSAVSLSASGTKLYTGGNGQPNLTIASLSGVAGSVCDINAQGLTVGSDNKDTVFAGTLISHLGFNLQKVGTGTLTLTGTNTFGGGIDFEGGFIQAAGLDNLGNGKSLLFNGGGLRFDGVFDPSAGSMFFPGKAMLDTQANDITLSKSIGNYGIGGLTKLGTGKLTLNGEGVYYGDTVVEGGTLEIAGGLRSSSIDVKSGKVVLKTVNLNRPSLDIDTDSLGTLEVLDGTHVVGTIAGEGTTRVDKGATLTAASITQKTLIIGGSSASDFFGAGEGLQKGTTNSVPEPSAFVLLCLGAGSLLGYCLSRRK